MIKAIIFDCFGVLTTDDWLAFRDAYFERGSETDIKATELNRQVDASLITFDEFVEGIAGFTEITKQQVLRQLNSHTPNTKLFDYIRDTLKPKYKIGLCSNASDDYTGDLFTLDQNALFDTKTFSFMLGVIKPDPLMYEATATGLDVLANECVFIDDREGFVEGAKAIGMEGIRFRSNEQVISELEKLLNA